MSTNPYDLTADWDATNRYGPASGDTDINISNRSLIKGMGWAVTAGTTAPTQTPSEASLIPAGGEKAMTLLDTTYIWLVSKTGTGAATIED